ASRRKGYRVIEEAEIVTTYESGERSARHPLGRLQGAASAASRAKPLLRGWIHAVAAVGALVLLALLLAPSPIRSSQHGRLALLTYGSSLVELYAVSAVFHLGRWRGQSYQYLKLLDHASIFVLIAATASAFIAVSTPPAALRTALSGLIWAMASAGVGLK